MRPNRAPPSKKVMFGQSLISTETETKIQPQLLYHILLIKSTTIK